MTPLWTPGEYLIATPFGPYPVFGLVYRNLGMNKGTPGSPKGRRPPIWVLSHQGTGHRVCSITAHIVEAFDIATEVAECSNWDFDGLEGYLNRDPQLPDKIAAFFAKYPKQMSRAGGSHPPSQEVAREIAEARAA